MKTHPGSYLALVLVALALNLSVLQPTKAATWAFTGSMIYGRDSHTATLLPNGQVLVAGARGGDNSAELYDPATGTWTATSSMTAGRSSHTATLLANGRVLVVGGEGSSGSLSSAELYDPASGTWTATGSLTTARQSHTATLLPNGQVLVAGGWNGGPLSSAELYNPASGTWTATNLLTTARYVHTATLLPNGQVLVAGGYGSSGYLSSAGLYDVGLGFTNSWQPQIATVTSPFSLGSSMMLTGSQFLGISEGSGGNSQNSPADYPVVQLRRLDNEQTVFLSTMNWSTNSFTSLPVWNFPPGYALVTMFVNGIQSTSSVINISVPVPTAPTLTGAQARTSGSFQFAFTNSVGALFGVLASTNLALPLTNWTALGGVMEISPGQFQFTDPQAMNNLQRFYRTYSP